MGSAYSTYESEDKYIQGFGDKASGKETAWNTQE
jgi:hypothetical protein